MTTTFDISPRLTWGPKAGASVNALATNPSIFRFVISASFAISSDGIASYADDGLESVEEGRA
jgi:hypothetical protein